MAYRQVTAGRESLDLLHRLQLSPQSKTPDTVLEWTELYTDHAGLDNLPESIDRCRNFKRISAAFNRLSSLPQSISNLPHLTVLNLKYNAFSIFPIALCGLINLEELYLNNNQLSDIPVDISRIKWLRIFHLYNNAFTTFPIALCGLTNLEELDLSYNKLSDIPVDITRMKVLRIFILSCSAFTTFPIALCGLTNLEELYLSYNMLSDIKGDISTTKGLRLFRLNDNAFTTFPIALFDLTNLVALYLDNNWLSDIPVDITRMKGLRIFSLKYNAFTSFPIALCDLTNLEELHLSYNQLSDIPVDISRLTKVKILMLAYNKITHLPPQMRNMESLTELDVEGNPLVQPPQDTAKRGVDAIKRYFEALIGTRAIQSSRIQVNFLGETEAGKTSISRTLQQGVPTLTKMADRTRVVEQGTWEADEGFGFNINDFGGHDVYKIGHSILISTRGLVFITFNLSEYDPEQEGHYQLYIGNWIDKVQAQIPGIQIALIGTHLDEVATPHAERKCSAITRQLGDHASEKKKWYQAQKETCENKIKEIPEAQASLHQAYKSKAAHLQTLCGQMKPIYEHIFTLSSKTLKGVQELKDYLVSFARRSAEVLPRMWVEAAKNICTKKIEGSENTLGWEVIEDLILQNAPASWKEKHTQKEKERTVCDILSFLAHRGDIIWFDRSPSLMKVVFHKQEVIVNALKAVLTHDQGEVSQKLQKAMKITRRKAPIIEEDIFSRGIVSKQAMSCLCEPFKLSSTEVDVMIEMMLKLELCYQVQEDESLPSNTSYHFPWLLTGERQPELDTKWPSKVPPDTTQLTLQVLFQYRCPHGLYEKCSVRQHKHLGLMKTMRMDWKDGVYAELEGCKMQLTRGPLPSNPDAVSQVPDWVISIAVRGSHLSDMWRVLMRGHRDLMAIINEDWPGLSYDKYLVCPHCVSEDSEHQPPSTTAQNTEVPTKRKRYCQKTPTLFPGEILDQSIGTASKPRQVPCVNTGVSIPADLVYPPSWQEVLRKEKPKLCENITEPCLLDMLNVFLQEGIITDREAETVKTEPSTDRVKCPKKVAVFLDIITRKPVRAHVTLCQCLQEQGQTDLLELIKPAFDVLLPATKRTGKSLESITEGGSYEVDMSRPIPKSMEEELIGSSVEMLPPDTKSTDKSLESTTVAEGRKFEVDTKMSRSFPKSLKEDLLKFKFVDMFGLGKDSLRIYVCREHFGDDTESEVIDRLKELLEKHGVDCKVDVIVSSAQLQFSFSGCGKPPPSPGAKIVARFEDRDETGTLGGYCSFSASNPKIYGLTNDHVAVQNNLFLKGNPQIQDTNECHDEHYGIRKWGIFEWSPLVDIAAIEFPGLGLCSGSKNTGLVLEKSDKNQFSEEADSGSIGQCSGSEVNPTNSSELRKFCGEKVYKHGATTGNTEGCIDSVDTDSRLEGATGIVIVKGVGVGCQFSDKGDSGSIVYLKETNEPIAMITGILSDGSSVAYTVCFPLRYGLEELEKQSEKQLVLQDNIRLQCLLDTTNGQIAA